MPIRLIAAAQRPGSPPLWCVDDTAGAAFSAAALEEAFDAVRREVISLISALRDTPGATLSHTVALAPNISDLAHQLAWTRLVDQLAARANEDIRLACSDPWLYRHLATRPGVITEGAAPALCATETKARLRGRAARLAFTLRAAKARARLKAAADATRPGGAWLLAYGHPASRADGTDAYFGDLMAKLPELRRALHVDAPPATARALASPATVSLHGFAPLGAIAHLAGARWRPNPADNAGNRWLVRRAAVSEASGAQAAGIAWQIACQAAWLNRVRPAVIAWPWENHAWERALVKTARSLGVRTIGYVHVPFNGREWNFGADALATANTAPSDALPDTLAVCGAAAQQRLIAWGAPAERTVVVGSLRFAQPAPLAYAADGPVFVALPADPAIAQELAEAAGMLAAAGRRVIVRAHPLAPIAVPTAPGIARASQPLGAQEPLACVVYASTTVGLEALAGGLPTVRFLPAATIGWAAPDGVAPPPAASLQTLAETVANAPRPAPVNWDQLAAPSDDDAWRRLLAA